MENLITSEEFYNNRIKLMKSESLFEKLIKTDRQDFIKLGIETHNIQLINQIDNKQEIGPKLEIKTMPKLAVLNSSNVDTKIFETKTDKMITLNLKEYTPKETLKPGKLLNNQKH